jgi:hypothetical protein
LEAERQRLKELEEIKAMLEKLLEDERQAKRDEEIVRNLQAQSVAILFIFLFVLSSCLLFITILHGYYCHHYHHCCFAGVEITTRQLAKCEWNLELASNFLHLLASFVSVFFFLSVSLFPPLIESYSSPIPKYKHTPDTVIYLLL